MGKTFEEKTCNECQWFSEDSEGYWCSNWMREVSPDKIECCDFQLSDKFNPTIIRYKIS